MCPFSIPDNVHIHVLRRVLVGPPDSGKRKRLRVDRSQNWASKCKSAVECYQSHAGMTHKCAYSPLIYSALDDGQSFLYEPLSGT